MRYTDGVNYARGTVFTREKRLAMTPEHVYRFFCYKAFGVPEPTDDDVPLGCHSYTLVAYKKGISFFPQMVANGMNIHNLETRQGLAISMHYSNT